MIKILNSILTCHPGLTYNLKNKNHSSSQSDKQKLIKKKKNQTSKTNTVDKDNCKTDNNTTDQKDRTKKKGKVKEINRAETLLDYYPFLFIIKSFK